MTNIKQNVHSHVDSEEVKKYCAVFSPNFLLQYNNIVKLIHGQIQK